MDFYTKKEIDIGKKGECYYEVSNNLFYSGYIHQKVFTFRKNNFSVKTSLPHLHRYLRQLKLRREGRQVILQLVIDAISNELNDSSANHRYRVIHQKLISMGVLAERDTARGSKSSFLT